jgi:hypothetical protein
MYGTGSKREWRYILRICLVLALMAAMSPGKILAATNQPTLRLFPTAVVENIRQTGKTAKNMEENLHGVISDLEQQMKLYNQSKCQGASGDEGCQAIIQQMNTKFDQMLSIMQSELPEMERTIKATESSLQSRISSQIGRNMTPRDVQKMLAGETSPTQKRTSRFRDRSLSERFQKYLDLVRTHGQGGQNSLAVVAANTYLDVSEVGRIISLTKDEIARAKIRLRVNKHLGQVTPQMEDVVSSVKTLLFGEPESAGQVPGAAQPSGEDEYRSPLEM